MTSRLRAFIDGQDRLADDGAVDPVAVDRLLAGTIDWRRTTQAERVEAARRAVGSDRLWTFATDDLHLNSPTVRRILAETT